MPILTRLGCNTGGCHGRAAGQNGFHLSLFGYDPDGDFLALARDAGQRRLSKLAPEESLFLAKATGRVAARRRAAAEGRLARIPDPARLGQRRRPEHSRQGARGAGQGHASSPGTAILGRARPAAVPRRRPFRRRPRARRDPAGLVQGE